MEEMNDTCFLITGLLIDRFIPKLLYTYENIPNKIFSTWKDQDPNLLNILRENKFTIVLNEYPSNRVSRNYQNTNGYNGCLKALELGFKYVIRIRTDLFINNCILFKNTINHLFRDKICLLGWYTHNNGYILDHFHCGPVEKLLKLYLPQIEVSDLRFSEKFFQEEYCGKNDLTFEESRDYFNYCIELLYKNKIVLYTDHISGASNPDIVNHFYNIYQINLQHNFTPYRCLY